MFKEAVDGRWQMADGRLEKIDGGWQSRLTTNSTWERFELSRVRKVRRVREILHLLSNNNKPPRAGLVGCGNRCRPQSARTRLSRGGSRRGPG
jgi:hypothetical protein